MKKFSKNKNKEPEVKSELISSDKVEILKLIDMFIKISISGPIRRPSYTWTIEGKDLLADAIINFMDNKDNKNIVEALSEVKYNLIDIDSKISEMKSIPFEIRNKFDSISKKENFLELFESIYNRTTYKDEYISLLSKRRDDYKKFMEKQKRQI